MEVIINNNCQPGYHLEDAGTKKHCCRVEHYVMEMAQFFKGEISSMSNLMLAAELHDIGKTTIPPEILNKPSKLSDEEYEIMKTHSLSSYRIARNVANEEVARICLEHHERIDGKGYPQGLKGNEISMEAKLISVADAYDAMTSQRAYHEPMSENDALRELERCADKQFDIRAVFAMINVVKHIDHK